MSVSLDSLSEFLSGLFGATPAATVDLLDALPAETTVSQRATMIRLAALHPSGDMLWFYRLHNAWLALGSPPLKPNPTRRKVLLLADFTAGQLPPLLSIMCAARGVHLDLELGPFDSVEQEIPRARRTRTRSRAISCSSVCRHTGWPDISAATP